MAKVHPNLVPAAAVGPAGGERGEEEAAVATTLTVWRKSLLFNCKGFTVFDAKGNLAYRVDSYDSESGDEVVLMDAAGAPAFTVRRKRQLSLQGEQWLVFAGEADQAARRSPVYAVRRSGRGNKSLASVTPCAGAGGASAAYDVEGSYARRCCVVYDGEKRAVAEVRPKEAVGTDVFRLVVQPGVGVSLAMAVVVALDQMFGRPSLLRSWSSYTSPQF
ncbi:hypothetical protein E2562_013515 [Oryza meyeriana var. granulata]|uniref:Protein LURP-one-related 8 n=1 Tax=Oryza meyeriana var. granulata TaxID=110450 RepID=A0A6G1BWA9_9ORYZ|nr:hypothetical protein E2562_013515 [Oryza meyeriana var. granulata]